MPPKTWKQYRDVAEFFTRPKDDLYGHIAMPGAAIAADFYENAQTYGLPARGFTVARRASVENGGLMNSERAIAWLTDYCDLKQFGPPGIESMGWEEAAGQFLAGRVAMAIVWADSVAEISNPSVSKLKPGQADCTWLPIEPKYMLFHIPTIYGDMGTYCIASASRHKEAAFIFAQYLSSPEIQAMEMEQMNTICTRVSLLYSTLASEMDRKLGWNYFNFMKTAWNLGELYGPEIAIAEGADVYDLANRILPKAYVGEVTPKQALDELAEAVDARMKELGW